MKVIYLQESLSMNGRYFLRERKLYDQFLEISDEILLGHAIMYDEGYNEFSNEQVINDVIPYNIVLKFQPGIVYIEGGLLASKDIWKIPEEIAFSLLEKGVVVIVSGVDINRAREYKQEYYNARKLLNAVIDYGDDGHNPVYGVDF